MLSRFLATLRGMVSLLPLLPPRTEADQSVVVQAVVLRHRAPELPEVLLVHRFSPRAWEIPGGRPDDQEPLDRAVVREVLEETSMVVTVARRVATFRRSGFRPHVSPVFRCEVVSGVPRPNDEAVAAAFFPIDRLPWGTFPWLRKAIEIAVADLRAPEAAVCSPDGHQLEQRQHLGFASMLVALLIHMAGIARLRS